MIELEPTPLGRSYVRTEKKGPYIRVNKSQENHVDQGLQFWWKSELPDVIADKTASDHGTILHGYMAGLLQGETINVVEEWAKRPMEVFGEWVQKEGIKASWTERTLVSDKLGLGGTIDAYIPALGLVDWKTGEAYPSYAVQMALYAYLYYENNPGPIPPLYLIYLHRDGKKKIKVTHVKNAIDALRAGLMTFERWKWDNFKVLKWLHAPGEVLDAYKKTRGKKREEFVKREWREDYAWAWLDTCSIRHFYNHKPALQRLGLGGE